MGQNQNPRGVHSILLTYPIESYWVGYCVECRYLKIGFNIGVKK